MTKSLRQLKHKIDATAQGISMYKGLLFGLIGVIGLGLVLAMTGVIGISALGLLAVTLVVTAASFVANKTFAAILRVPTNSDSWLITALIIACIVAPSTDPLILASAALAGVIAMASKYILAFRGSVILNPAAAGVFIAGLAGSLPTIWWVATPYMLFATVPLALTTLYRHKKFSMFSAFFITAFIVLLIINGMTQNEPFLTVLELAIVSWPLIFLGSVMLTEPSTVPTPRYLQIFYAVIVGALTTAQLQYGPVETSPQFALLIGNICIAFIMPPFARRLKLIQINKLSDNVTEFVFHKPKNMEFTAGQYMDWTLAHKKTDFRGARRRFSIASAPSESELRFTTRFDDKHSSYKQALLNMDIDDLINASNIKGEFVLPKAGSKLLFIAGGIGITPFRSMIGELINRKEDRDIVLIYTSSTKTYIYGEVFKKAKKYGVKTLLADKRLTFGEIEHLVPDVRDRSIYISGPDAMATSYKESLIDNGIKRRKIRTDHFSGY